jgi:hypothetical protein
VYRLINEYAAELVATIAPGHVAEYDWLRENTGAVSTLAYQTRYRAFWQMNAARLSPGFCDIYFATLRKAIQHAPELGLLTHTLYETATHLNGRQSLQFSFATKLLHMVNPRAPIYDSLIARFFFFAEPPRERPLEQRIDSLVAVHGFLVREYARILKERLLESAIMAFRERLRPRCFTDEKCVDSLIWAFVAFLKKGGVSSGKVVYR